MTREKRREDGGLGGGVVEGAPGENGGVRMVAMMVVMRMVMARMLDSFFFHDFIAPHC